MWKHLQVWSSFPCPWLSREKIFREKWFRELKEGKETASFQTRLELFWECLSQAGKLCFLSLPHFSSLSYHITEEYVSQGIYSKYDFFLFVSLNRWWKREENFCTRRKIKVWALELRFFKHSAEQSAWESGAWQIHLASSELAGVPSCPQHSLTRLSVSRLF